MQMNKVVVAKRYDEYGEDFEEHCLKLEGDFDQRVLQFLGEYIKRDTLLLDVAGGDGWATSLLDAEKVSVIATDISSGLLRVARERRGNHLCGLIHDFDNELPFIDETFHYVVCTGALEFCANLDFTLAQMFRVLKKDGLMLFTTDRLDPSSTLQNDRLCVYDDEGFFAQRRTTNEVLKVISNLNARLLKQQTYQAFRLQDDWIMYDYFLVQKSARKQMSIT